MRLVLLLSFVLPGFLVTVADLPPDYEYENNEVVLDDDDWLYDDDTVYYEDSSSDIPVVPKNKDIRVDEEEIPEFKGIEAADLEDNDDEEGVVSGAVKPIIDGSYSDGNDVGHDYENFKRNLHRFGYPGKNYLRRNRRQYLRGAYGPHTLSYNEGHNGKLCGQGHRRDSLGRCRKILR